MDIVVIDGQGGGLGKSIVEAIRNKMPKAFIIAVGTNATATGNMLRGGASVGSTGENAVIYNTKKADIIIGPMGIAFANAMYGEVSPAMAQAVSESAAMKYLIPISKLNVYIPGQKNLTINEYIEECVSAIHKKSIEA